MTALAPSDMRAPAAAYTLFFVLFVINLIGCSAYLVWRARTSRSTQPLAALGGGLAAGCVLPPIFNALTDVWFPSNIPHPLVTAFGMRDPAFDSVGYAVFMGFGGWVLCESLRGGRGARAIWATFLVWGVADLTIELPFLRWGLYSYYGPQPLTIGGFPAHWVFMNGAVPVVSGVLMWVLAEHWPASAPRVPAPWRVAAAPALAGGLLLVPMAPVATSLHANIPQWVRVLAALLCAAISIGAVRLLAAWSHRSSSV